MSTLHISHPSLGLIHVTERRGSHRVSARWKGGQLHVNIPAGLPADRIDDAIERMREDLERIRPRHRYHIGTKIEILPETGTTPAFILCIAPALPQHRDMTVTGRSEGATTVYTLYIPTDADISTPSVQTRIDSCIKNFGRRLASDLLLPHARKIADSLGLRVDSWEIAHGRTVLGTCYPRQRRIRLSYLNVFLPPELRDYIIRHELAHLTEPGHTAAFHTLCDRYCSGRESQLTHSLRNYHWPVDR